MRRAAAVAFAVGVLGLTVAFPASASLEDDLRETRLELQAVITDLEAATWENRIATDTGGLMQFEHDELLVDATALEADYAVAKATARSRSLEIFYVPAGATWSERSIAGAYLQAALGGDRATLDTKAESVEVLNTYLEEMAIEIEAYAADALESETRIADLSEEWARLEAELAEIAAAYEAEAAYNATTTTTTTTIPSTTTTTGPAPTTTTTAGGGTTTTTVAGTDPTTTTTTTPTTTTTLPPPVVLDGKTCPVAGPVHFTDTFGAPRSGGRTHQGVDMMADRGTPLVAIESGTIGRLNNGGLGGITIWFYGDSGDQYYYAHLDDWAPGLAQGQHVEVGDLVGYNGSTGNAPDAYPHLHFEIHPGGGAAINPYPIVAALCL